MKKKQIIFILSISSLLFFSCKKQENINKDTLELWYKTSSSTWEQYLPLGNGRLGAMPSGNVYRETLVLNDITLWSGSTDSTQQNKQAAKYLPKIQNLLLHGKNKQAQDLMYKHFTCGGQGSAFGQGANAPYGSYQVLGNLRFIHKIPHNTIENYRRGLLLEEAIAYTTFTTNGVDYKREYFVSHSDDLIVIRLTSNEDHKISFDLSISRPERYKTFIDNDLLCMEGMLNSGQKDKDGVRYQTKVKIIQRGGQLTYEKNSLNVTKADTAYVLISSSTNLLDKNYIATTDSLLNAAQTKSYNILKTNHIKAYRNKFNRVALNLGKNNNTIPTDERLQLFKQDDDPALVALYFHYCRYLMICGTRENSLPLNLQGLWANTINTPWNGDYHLNINVQMNYWPVEIINQPELHIPLIELTKKLSEAGEETAKTFYNAKGWVAHIMTNPWFYTAPGEDASWGATNTGGAWLCKHLWEHYAFSQNKDYLEKIYPIMKGAAEFFLSSMIIEKDSGWLVTAPSSSPENGFYMPKTKQIVQICMGPTMDIQILTELFNNIITATKILNKDHEFAKELTDALVKFPPMQISSKGYLQEWLKDYDEAEITHRHISHLYGLYPGSQISIYRTPELAEAAKVTLNRRGDGSTGWSRAWKINFWARLHDGERAYKLLKSLLEPVAINGTNYDNNGGTYPNLFCSHPPFQIDGNFGGCAGIAEMLIQSQDSCIEILPAIPEKWRKKGLFKGLCVRGGASVDVAWNDSSIIISMTAKAKNNFVIKKPVGYNKYLIYKEGITMPISSETDKISLPMQHGEQIVIACEK